MCLRDPPVLLPTPFHQVTLRAPPSHAAPRRLVFRPSQHFLKSFYCKQTPYAPAAPSLACRRSTLEVRRRSLCRLYHASLPPAPTPRFPRMQTNLDRKSTRLNSSHLGISYAVFCLKKKKKNALCTWHFCDDLAGSGSWLASRFC